MSTLLIMSTYNNIGVVFVSMYVLLHLMFYHTHSQAPSRGRRPGRRSVVREIESDEEPEAADGDDDDNFPEIG